MTYTELVKASSDVEKSDLGYLFRYISRQNLVLAAFGRFVDCPSCGESAFVPALKSVAHCTFCDSLFEVDVLQKDGAL